MSSSLSPSQLQSLRTAIDSETDPDFVTYRTNGQSSLMRDWFNSPHATVKAWDSNASWEAIQNAIEYAKYTPSTANIPIDTTGTNKLLAILIKLTVQQNMLIGMQQRLDATDSGTITALLDTVTGIPSGAGGSVVQPGGAQGGNVAAACTRPALRAEVVFGGSDVVNGGVTAKLLMRTGTITDLDIGAALEL